MTPPKNKTTAQMVYVVLVGEAKPNKMFTEEVRQLVRFIHFNVAVPCAFCGRRSKKHWTLLCSFHAISMTNIFGGDESKVFMPFTPVCTAHPVGPKEIVEAERAHTR